MQISKTTLAVCAMAIGAALLVQAREDTDSQAKAREALRRKLAELEGQPVPTAPKVSAAPATTPAPAISTTSPAVTKEEVEKLREAVRRKIGELNTSDPVAAPAKPAPKTASPPITKPYTAVVQLPPPESKSRLTPEQDQALREALRRRIADLNEAEKPAPPTTKPAPVVAAPAQPTPTSVPEPEKVAQPKSTKVVKARPEKVEKPKPVKVEKPAPAPKPEKPPKAPTPPAPAVAKEFAPLPAPPTLLPASKEARLAELLRKYRADEITPAEYHQERAKVLAEP